MAWPIIMHVNCCEQGQTIDDICRNCARWGFDGVELRRKRSGVKENAENYLDSISKAIEKYKVRNVLFGSPGVQRLEGNKAEREQEIEEMIRFFEMASARFRLTVCNTFAGPIINPDKSVPYSEYTRHGSFIAKKEHWDWAVNCYKVLGNLAQKLGFVLSFETHMCYLDDIMESTTRLVKEIDNPAVGINLDYGNLVYFDNPPSMKDAVDLAGDRLYYVHLKNSIELPGGKRITAGLGEGDINNREYLKILKESGYSGPICIEVPCDGDREWYAKKDLYYLQKLIEEIS